VLNDKGYDGRAADIWSAGVILYVLLAGFLPFDEPHMSALFRKIQKAEFTYPSWFTPQVRHLLDRIMVADPTKRATIGDLEADPWFVGPDGYHDTEVAPAATAAGDDKEGDDLVEDVDDEKPAAAAAGGAGGAGAAAAATTAAPASAAKAAKTGGPAVLNAFEVVNMFGGLTLNRLLEAGERREKLLTVTPQFISAMAAPTILGRISAALSSMGAEVTVDDKSYKIKGKLMSARGQVSVVVQVFAISEALHLVELKRGRGDILEYTALYTRLRDLTTDLVTKGSMGRMVAK